MTVEKNITYVPVISGKKNKEENRKNAARLLKTVGLEEEMLKRYPNELSGGQQPVSYTHLDVYKRQADRVCRRGGICDRGL